MQSTFLKASSAGSASLEVLVASDDSSGDHDAGEEETGSGKKKRKRKEVLLLQRLLAKATQPSPIKAIFAADELEAAALAVSQYLASAAAAKKANLGSPVAATAVDSDAKDVTAVIDVADSTTKQLSNSATSVSSSQHHRGRHVTSRDLRRRHRQRVAEAPPAPMSATVRQLVEMGFPRHAVERAVKEIDGVGELGPSPESIVGWLLEHPPGDDEDDHEEDYGSEEDSLSDSFEDIDASGASEQGPLGLAAAACCLPPPDQRQAEMSKRRADFSSNDEYALYVRERLRVGLAVRCCRTYEEVSELCDDDPEQS